MKYLSINIEDYMLPCINKKMFGIDCLGCGMQRSLLLVLKGDFTGAFKMYPAIFTIIILVLFILINFKMKFKNSKRIIITLAIINVAIIITSYVIKMNNLIN